ncbi:MAG: MFS transporter [Planctomycetota bacterium]|jgi:MFS family permease
MPVEPATREPVTFRLCMLLGFIFFGVNVTEACSVYLLPLTLNLFTENPQYIFWILAINPAFGAVAQPLVGVLSDRTWTRVGRRAFYLITCAPVVALCLVFIPHIGSFALLIAVIVVLQFFQDLLNGSDQPLLADLVPPHQRTFIIGFVKTFENMAFFAVLYIGMRIVKQHAADTDGANYGMPMYYVAAGCQLVFVMGAAFFLNEKHIERQPRPTLTPFQYVRDFFHQPMLPRIAFAYLMRAAARTAVVGSVALYATKTLQFDEEQLGSSWGMFPFIAFCLAIPLGLSAERFAKHRVLQVAFAAIIVGCAVGYFADGVAGLAAAAFIFAFGDMLLEVTHKAFMSDHYPADIIGQLAGAVNIFYAVGRTIALIVVGYTVKWANSDIDFDDPNANPVFVDYHVIWLLSAGAAIIGIAILATVHDARHTEKQNSTEP